MPDRALIVASGGLDSTVVAYAARAAGLTPTLLAVNYGQRHVRELDAVRAIGEDLDAETIILDLPALGPLLRSGLLDPEAPVPEDPYTPASVAALVVPHRNALLLDLAVAIAASRGIDVVALGIHAGDHAAYPDTTPRFLAAYQRMARISTGNDRLQIVAPFLTVSKTGIVRRGHDLGVPFALTWSCYAGKEVHCGRCPTCRERRGAFAVAGIPDPTLYAAD